MARPCSLVNYVISALYLVSGSNHGDRRGQLRYVLIITSSSSRWCCCFLQWAMASRLWDKRRTKTDYRFRDAMARAPRPWI